MECQDKDLLHTDVIILSDASLKHGVKATIVQAKCKKLILLEDTRNMMGHKFHCLTYVEYQVLRVVSCNKTLQDD